MDDFSSRETSQLLTSGAGSTRNSITTLSTPARASHVTTQYSSSYTTGSGSKRSSARVEAELIQARGRISQLELELELTKVHRASKRARIDEDEEEEEAELERQSFTTSQELERLHTLDEERQSLAKQLADAQDKLDEREKEEGEEIKKLKTRLNESERREREKNDIIEELRSEVSTLTNQNRLLDRQLSVARSECEVVRTGLNEQLRVQFEAGKVLREKVVELDGSRGKWEAEQERVKELQHKLRQAKHDIHFAESVQSKLLHSEELERETRHLQEENAALRNHTDNVGLMRYQLQTLREQVERNEDMERKAVKLEEENKILREQLAGNRGNGDRIGPGSSGMQCKLTELQHKEVVLLGQLGDLQSRLKLVQRSADKAETLAAETQKELSREKEESKLKGEKIQRLEKRLLFVSKLRDGCVNVLNSYRLESGVDALLKENLAEVERQLSLANDRIIQLETELEQANTKL